MVINGRVRLGSWCCWSTRLWYRHWALRNLSDVQMAPDKFLCIINGFVHIGHKVLPNLRLLQWRAWKISQTRVLDDFDFLWRDGILHHSFFECFSVDIFTINISNGHRLTEDVNRVFVAFVPLSSPLPGWLLLQGSHNEAHSLVAGVGNCQSAWNFLVSHPSEQLLAISKKLCPLWPPLNLRRCHLHLCSYLLLLAHQ